MNVRGHQCGRSADHLRPVERYQVGITGTIVLSVATILFDVWGIVAVQPTALMGMVLPVVFIAYLLWNRAALGAGVRSIESAGGVRH